MRDPSEGAPSLADRRHIELSHCDDLEVSPSSRTPSEHWADSTVLRESLPWAKQLLPQGRSHLAVDIHLPVGEQVLHHIIVPLLGCQVQTRGALSILHTTTQQTLRDAQEQQRSSHMEQRTPKVSTPLPKGQRAGVRFSTKQNLGALH